MNPYQSPEYAEPAKCPQCHHCNPDLDKDSVGERFLTFCFCVAVAFGMPAVALTFVKALAIFYQR